LSQHIAAILHETYANYHVITYDECYYSNSNEGQNADFALFELIKHTNIDIKDLPCLHVVHILQHRTSRPITRSTDNTMVNPPKKNFSPLPAGKYGKSTMQSTCRHHQANEGKCGLVAVRVRALGALRGLRSKKKLAAEKRQETHFLSNEEKEKWIEDFVDRETAVARKCVQDAETAIMQDMTTAENECATTGKPETMFEEMLNAIGDSLSDFASSDNEQDGEDEEDDEEDTELGKLSDDDEPGWVMSTITKTVQHRMESFEQKQMRLDELTQPGWGDAASYFRERDMRYGTAELKVPAVVKPQMHSTTATPSPITVGEHIQTPEIVRGQSNMPAVTSRPASSQMRLGSEKPQTHKFTPRLSPSMATDSMPIQDAKPVEPVSFYPGMKHA
jgi:hypothetical protein